jgi:hypothetical protein
LYVIYDLQTGTFNVSTDPPTYTVSNSKVHVTSPINAEYDLDKVIIYKVNWYEIDSDYILTQLDTFVRKQQADTITAIHTFNPIQPGPAFQLGPNAQNQLIQYLNADKVDGFDVSQTPAPNTIPVALPTGKLDIGWLPDGIGVYRRVDLTNATSDYELQVGEEAIIYFDTTRNTVKPLRVKTNEGLYQMFIWARYDTSNNHFVVLYPNNQSYSNAFTGIALWLNEGANLGHLTSRGSGFSLGRIIQGGLLMCYFSTYRLGKFMLLWQTVVGSVGFGRLLYMVQRWDDTRTSWSSLGTISTAGSRNGTLVILVRRLL